MSGPTLEFLTMLKQCWYRILHQKANTLLLKIATKLSGVDITFRRPGIIFIAGERIEYYEANGNVLGKLVRGTLGTGAGSIYSRHNCHGCRSCTNYFRLKENAQGLLFSISLL